MQLVALNQVLPASQHAFLQDSMVAGQLNPSMQHNISRDFAFAWLNPGLQHWSGMYTCNVSRAHELY